MEGQEWVMYCNAFGITKSSTGLSHDWRERNIEKRLRSSPDLRAFVCFIATDRPFVALLSDIHRDTA